MQNEIWKVINNYNGYYEVSNFGRVRSITRKIERTDPNNSNKKMLFTYKGKLIPFWITKKGYCRCTLNIKGNKKNHLVHQLVAKAFLVNENNKPQVNHINCIKTDNTVENLEWVTNTENHLHAKENGLLYYQKL
tara:strand:+ start:79 stop:480 length:402 start_codon:yes stop_codon:yes gene_type:complete